MKNVSILLPFFCLYKLTNSLKNDVAWKVSSVLLFQNVYYNMYVCVCNLFKVGKITKIANYIYKICNG